MKRIVIGMTAHVDSGKTTLSEALLYTAGELRKLGRVDHGDTFLDSDPIERSRGITVFSKQAVMRLDGDEYTLLDTPGHVDFSTETERALRVLDYAVLVISGTDGVQSHTETLWRLLKRYDIPAFIFVNKMDISFLEKQSHMNELKRKLSPGCVELSDDNGLTEELAECSEELMNSYLDSGDISDELIAGAIKRREVFPVIFGSALKLRGVKELINAIERFTRQPQPTEEFGAVIYKITTDEQGARLTHMKITGGSLKVKAALECGGKKEKVNQIRIYSGTKFTTTDEAPAGTLCAVTGLSSGSAGEGLGTESSCPSPLLEPVMTYRMVLPPKTDIPTTLAKLQELCDEDPMLRIVWNEQLKEIHVHLMGEIQLEVLTSVLRSRFGLEAAFDQGSIAYKETIAAPVEGVGHYEPLRHYAEVHLLLEPGERGTGLQFFTDCRRDDLDTNWQRLILTHLEEKTHIGVLTGSPITDMKITVVAGKAHIKHTEGGDFRQATYRAVRQGLRSARSVLLEPWYDFTLTVPQEFTGRAMTDLQRMNGEIQPPRNTGDETEFTGSAPVSELRGYQGDVMGYTRGKGRLSCVPGGYRPCHNTDEVIAATGYDCDADTENSADSVFCSHGAGVLVPWNEAPARMHVDSGLRFGENDREEPEQAVTPQQVNSYKQRVAADKELMEIFERTYGRIKRDERSAMRTEKRPPPPKTPKLPLPPKGPEYLLVDGYNIIFGWEELNKLAKENLELARTRLINILCNYQGFRRCELILVFDAYRVKGNHREIEKEHGITVVYTKEAETADMFIEKTAHQLGKDKRVRVATSDNVEQIIIMGSGAIRVSASEFLAEVKEVEEAIRRIIEEKYL
ncbi:MAG: TetM/TetW/TetO/TetS family tetracycline resistance ribosomal protection protein [Oscillospiraceae bacterium]|nr:TetM/TetW/TetO/TetS family tetracycline resistance ribosomal protection protein [Oscillospiraceae bacterium]